jgi:uncharacterized protein (TIGR01777 family)
MRVLVSGASGLIGAALVRALRRDANDVVRLVRAHGAAAAGSLLWDPAQGTFDAAGAEGADAVVHLAGENIASGRWTAARKRAVRESRVAGTRLLAEGLAGLARPPGVLITASAVGVYGDRGDEELTEASSPGQGFLADVCQAWEAATEPAASAGIRIVHLRFGVVLSAAGGALARMLLPFRLGLGGRLGSGRQWMSWVSLDDAVGIVRHALGAAGLVGAVNAVAPTPVRNADFTRALASALRRPALFPVPAIALRIVLGEMADELLLASQRTIPAALTRSGYGFRHPEVEDALHAALAVTP